MHQLRNNRIRPASSGSSAGQDRVAERGAVEGGPRPLGPASTWVAAAEVLHAIAVSVRRRRAERWQPHRAVGHGQSGGDPLRAIAAPKHSKDSGYSRRRGHNVVY